MRAGRVVERLEGGDEAGQAAEVSGADGADSQVGRAREAVDRMRCGIQRLEHLNGIRAVSVPAGQRLGCEPGGLGLIALGGQQEDGHARVERAPQQAVDGQQLHAVGHGHAEAIVNLVE